MKYIIATNADNKLHPHDNTEESQEREKIK